MVCISAGFCFPHFFFSLLGFNLQINWLGFFSLGLRRKIVVSFRNGCLKHFGLILLEFHKGLGGVNMQVRWDEHTLLGFSSIWPHICATNFIFESCHCYPSCVWGAMEVSYLLVVGCWMIRWISDTSEIWLPNSGFCTAEAEPQADSPKPFFPHCAHTRWQTGESRNSLASRCWQLKDRLIRTAQHGANASYQVNNSKSGYGTSGSLW